MTHSTHRVVAAGLCLLASLPALAQYKVVAPDGSVTYTDRQPAAPNAKVTALGREAAAAQAAPAAAPLAGSVPALAPVVDPRWPVELRQAATRYPVVLFTAAECAPCDSGRLLLQQRGVPFNERRVVTAEDTAALERLVGARVLPAMTVGTQAIRGLAQAEWAGYLDAAGYPKVSQLPRNWQPPAATLLAERAATPVAAAPEAAMAAPADNAAPTPIAPPAGVRF